jgi:hypothetical protein
VTCIYIHCNCNNNNFYLFIGSWSCSWSYFTTDRRSVSQSVFLGVGHPFEAHDQILLFTSFCRKIALLFVLGRPLWREDGSVIWSAISQWSESWRTRNHTLLSRLRLLGSFSVASYDPQGLRWKYSALSDERTGLEFVVQSVGGQSRAGLTTTHYCLTWDYWVPFPSPLTTRSDYGGSILPSLTRGQVCNL